MSHSYGSAAMLVILCAFAMTPRNSDEESGIANGVVQGRLDIVDEDGVPRISLLANRGSAAIELRNADGRVGLSLALTDALGSAAGHRAEVRVGHARDSQWISVFSEKDTAGIYVCRADDSAAPLPERTAAIGMLSTEKYGSGIGEPIRVTIWYRPTETVQKYLVPAER
jgi:hypothetical protein